MSIIDAYRSGDITLLELRDEAEHHPELAEEIRKIAEGEALSDEELEGIAGGGRPGHLYEGSAW